VIVRPEDWYRLFWVGWLIIAALVARWYLVEPIIKAIRSVK
jgi:hypothetical protein